MQQPGRIKSPALGLRRYGIPLLVAGLIGSLLLMEGGGSIHPYRLTVAGVTSAGSSSTIGRIQMDEIPGDEFVKCGNKDLEGPSGGCVVSHIYTDGSWQTIEQYNVAGRLIEGLNQSISSDYDQNGREELGVLYYRGDSLFYAIFKQGDDDPFLNLYLDSLGLDQGKGFAQLLKIGEYDQNQDGFLETYFYVGSRFALYPRRTYCVDLVHQTVNASPRSCVGFKLRPFGRKTTGRFTALTGTNHMPGNITPGYAYPWPDTTGYVYAFKPDLSWLLEPIPIVHYPGNARNLLKGDTIISFIRPRHSEAYKKVQYRDLSSGKLLKENGWPATQPLPRSYGPYYLSLGAENLQLFDKGMKLVKQRSLPHFRDYSRIVDNLLPGQDGFFTYLANEKSILLYDENFEEITRAGGINLKFSAPNARIVACHQENKTYLMIHSGKRIYNLALSPNAFYRWHWLLPIFIYGGSTLLSFGLFGLYRRNLEKRYQKERRMNQLQLLSLNKQVDPHFVLNALDSVDWMYRHQEWKEASSAMSRLSRLMQKSVLYAGQITVSLYEELDFCRNYCVLEENRTPDFTCAIAVGDYLDPKDIQVPRQLIFTHVENAIKHGIRPKEKGEKRLEVKLWREGPELHISITDTGIGRNSPKDTQGTGKGLKLLREIIPLYRKIKGVDIQLQINDPPGGGLQVKMILLGVLENPRG